MTSCKIVDEIFVERVHCAKCNRDYAIHSRQHICNPKFPCDSRALSVMSTFIEKHHPGLAPTDKIADCEECKERALSNVVHATCPSCKYEGRFAPSEGGLCPACIAGPAPKIKKERKQTETAGSTSKPVLYVYINKEALSDGEPPINLFKSISCQTATAVLSGKFHEIGPHYYETQFVSNNPKDYARILSDWLKEMAKNYDIRWWFPHESVTFDFLHSYYEHAPDNKYIIPLP